MKFLEPISEDLLPSRIVIREKYAELITRLGNLKNGQWLPIEFDNFVLARLNRDRLASAFRQGIGRRPIALETKVRGNVAYLRIKAKVT